MLSIHEYDYLQISTSDLKVVHTKNCRIT